MKNFLFGLLGLGLLFLNSCEKEVLPRLKGPGIVKLKSSYWQSYDGSNQAVYYHYDNQNRRIKLDVYEDSSLSYSYRYIWDNGPNGLTSQVYLLEDGDSTAIYKSFWNSITGFVDSTVDSISKTIFKIKIGPSGKPELIETTTFNNNTSFYGWIDSVYDGMIVRTLEYNSSSQDTIVNEYSYNDYTDFYSPFTEIPAFNALNKYAYLKQFKSTYRTYQGMPNEFTSKWLREYNGESSSQEFFFE